MEFDRLTPYQKRRLRLLHQRMVPGVVLELIVLLHLAGLEHGAIDAAEFFAGMLAITHGLTMCGFRTVAFEMKQDQVCEDMMSRCGFCYALAVVMALEPGAMIWSSAGYSASSCCN